MRRWIAKKDWGREALSPASQDTRACNDLAKLVQTNKQTVTIFSYLERLLAFVSKQSKGGGVRGGIPYCVKALLLENREHLHEDNDLNESFIP